MSGVLGPKDCLVSGAFPYTTTLLRIRSPAGSRGRTPQESCGFAGMTWGSEIATNVEICLRMANCLHDLGLGGLRPQVRVH